MENTTTITRKNGKPYLVRDNRDRFFYPNEWMSFFDNLKDSQKFTFEFLINTGARINEARNVKVEDIDFERRSLILRVTKVKAKKGESKPRPRIIPLSSQFCKRLKKYINQEGLQLGDYLKILSTPASNIALKKALIKSDIKDYYMFSVHNIRKSLETWLISLNVDGLKVTAHFGHEMKTASRHYVMADIFTFQDKQNIRLIIGDLYGN